MEEKDRTSYRDHGKGIIGVASHFLARYREFSVALDRTIAPPGSTVEWHLGVNVAFHYNNMIRSMLKNPDFKWAWILGDDHVWLPNLLARLLERDVDVVVPLCLRRGKPFTPVLNGGRRDEFRHLGDKAWSKLNGRTGLLPLTELVTGNAGMLIRRHVVEKIEEPWFRNGQFNPETNGMDLWFCDQVQQSEFKLYLDLDNRIGHLTHVAVWPTRDEQGNYGPDIRVP